MSFEKLWFSRLVTMKWSVRIFSTSFGGIKSFEVKVLRKMNFKNKKDRFVYSKNITSIPETTTTSSEEREPLFPSNDIGPSLENYWGPQYPPPQLIVSNTTLHWLGQHVINSLPRCPWFLFERRQWNETRTEFGTPFPKSWAIPTNCSNLSHSEISREHRWCVYHSIPSRMLITTHMTNRYSWNDCKRR